ncbi:MAG: amidohydrolase family protein [Gammaproteobacteria bacterium]|nr:amidohydrolase family protein [Gammaproteobacteria bacterium]
MKKLLIKGFKLLTTLVIALCLLRQILFSGPVVNPSPLPTQKIVDMHVHVAGIGADNSGCFVSDSIRNSFKFDYYLNAFQVTREELEQNGDQVIFEKLSKTVADSSHIDAAVVLALDGVIDSNGQLDLSQSEVVIPNRFVADNVVNYDNLLFGASINPYRKDAIQRLEQVKLQGARLIKWIPSIQMIDPSDPKITGFYRKMKELDLPLLTHTGQEKSFTRADDDLADPKRLVLPLSLGVKVIAAHIATTGETLGEDNMQRLLPMFEQYPNLYADISSLTQINKLGFLNRALVDPRVKGRLIYGSDFPLINMILVSPYYFPLNLTIAQMHSISSLDNVWDRDVALKQALGVNTEIFARSRELLNIR